MTKLLYMDNIESNYIKKFTAIVTKKKNNYVCFNQTAFYPIGGGQPSDIGNIEWNNNKSEVKEVIKKGNTIKHIINGEVPSEGENIIGFINWDLRYSYMKMHTSQHIISGIIFDNFNAFTVGNQIYKDYSRVDFYPVSFSIEDLKNIEKNCNEIISKRIPIRIYYEERDKFEKRQKQQRSNLDLLPKFIKKLRIVEIEGFDICPCAGTHVKNTNEIPEIKIIKKEMKGKNRERIVYKFLQ